MWPRRRWAPRCGRAARAYPLPPGLTFAMIGMGRLGGYELNFASDADVLFVYDPPAGVPDDAASAAAHAVAEELRRLLSMPAPDPPLGVDADLRPEGRQGPLVRSLAAYAQYYARWSKVWEAQALLRARPVAGDTALGERFVAMADKVRYPAAGLSQAQHRRDPADQGPGGERAAAPRRRPRHPRQARPGRARRRRVGRAGAPAPARRCAPVAAHHPYGRRARRGRAKRGCSTRRTPPRWPPAGSRRPGCATR